MRIKAPRNWRECEGIFIGGCVDRGEGSSFRAKAHCHNDPKYPHFGWICVRSLKRIGEHHLFDQRLVDIDVVNYQDFDGILDKPSQLMLHEYAHLLAPKQGHTPAFYKRLREISGRTTKADRSWAPKSVTSNLE